jgi:hypothetical protein
MFRYLSMNFTIYKIIVDKKYKSCFNRPPRRCFMDTLWFDARRRGEEDRDAAPLLPGPELSKAGPPPAGPRVRAGESAEMRLLKWRLHRFFALLSREV